MCDFLSLPESPFARLSFSLTALYRRERVSDPREKGRERQPSDHDGGGKEQRKKNGGCGKGVDKRRREVEIE